MKKNTWTAILAILILTLACVNAAQAEILPPYGEGQIGFRGVILCETLSLREKPSASSKVVETLEYGDFILVAKQVDGWAWCVLGDAEDSPAGWVNADYIVVDPAWYRADATTPVYAWNDRLAPKVALLDENVTLPILKEEGDWLIVSLRGAVGWIHK